MMAATEGLNSLATLQIGKRKPTPALQQKPSKPVKLPKVPRK